MRLWKKPRNTHGFSDNWYIRYLLAPKPTVTAIDVIRNDVTGKTELWIDGVSVHTAFSTTPPNKNGE